MRLFKFVATVCTFLFLSSAAVAGGCDDSDKLQALALNIYHEARGESEKGMRMVGEVTINRVSSSKYPDTICDVVYQGCQFSWTCSKKNKKPREKEAWEKSLEIAKELLNENVASYPHLATHFVNLRVARPSWTRKFDKVKKIGDHTFYRM
jgi:spore germination cell wall hydrolase CwlJ-like protein